MEQRSSASSLPKISPAGYDRTTTVLHWTTALLVAVQFLIGRTTNYLPRSSMRVDIWSVHVLVGFTLALVLAAGLLWRRAGGRRLPPSNPGFLHLLAMMTHGLLELLLIVMVVLGITNVFAHGFPLFNLWHFPRFGDDAFMHSVNAWHGFFANMIIVLASLHSAAALFHHYALKDNVLRRMWPRH